MAGLNTSGLSKLLTLASLLRSAAITAIRAHLTLPFRALVTHTSPKSVIPSFQKNASEIKAAI